MQKTQSTARTDLCKWQTKDLHIMCFVWRAAGTKEPYQDMDEDHRSLFEFGVEDIEILVDEKNLWAEQEEESWLT